ncbi:M4 family metallopeptidase [Aliikangiella maris]|uniref:M4 family metallopeptidase n=2 Tax=Aliikangiella maris TaxID=3162458 RepID=A0ABV3MV26_9GAMM
MDKKQKVKAAIIQSAKQAAEKKYGVLKKFERETAQLNIFYHELTGKAKLAYHVDLLASQQVTNNIIRHEFIIDADSGLVYQNWNALMSDTAITGPGGNTKTGQYHYGTDYLPLMGREQNNICYLENEKVKAVNLNHSYDYYISDPFQFNCYENTFKAINGAYSPINDAFYFGNIAFDMYQDWYNTEPLPFKLSMKVHYGNSVDNAYWTGDSMLFGDGYQRFYPLVDVNVSVHEVSHGFTDFNSDLIYSEESGGMNEAFSDIAGEAAEYYWKGEVDWLVGADIYKSNGALRYFADPTLDGVSIKHTDNYYSGLNVHYSSGIYNHAFYLIANTEGWNVKKAFDIFVLANQSYWVPNETFENGACGVLEAARDLDYQWFDVYKAFTAVGVYC